jgi:hypothetical protein
MNQNNEEPQPWDPQKNEPSASYALFNEYLKLGPLRTIPKLSEKLQNSQDYVNPPSKVSLEKKCSTWKWNERVKTYDIHRIEKEREDLEERANKRLIKRLDASEEIEDKLNEEILNVLSDDSLKPTQRAYAVKFNSDAKKNEVESQRLDYGEPTIINKSDIDIKGEIKNKNPLDDIAGLEETLKGKEDEG